jgi:hypothetical protein
MTILEAKLIVPITPGNCFVPVGFAERAHDALARKLAGTFGGYTASDADGGWIDDTGKLVQERVRVYVIAMPCDEDNARQLKVMARLLAEQLQEDCIYCKTPDGVVHFVTPGQTI